MPGIPERDQVRPESPPEGSSVVQVLDGVIDNLPLPLSVLEGNEGHLTMSRAPGDNIPLDHLTVENPLHQGLTRLGPLDNSLAVREIDRKCLEFTVCNRLALDSDLGRRLAHVSPVKRSDGPALCGLGLGDALNDDGLDARHDLGVSGGGSHSVFGSNSSHESDSGNSG